MRYTISTPVPGFTGMSAGVNFPNGQAVIDDEDEAAALRYFQAQGYDIAEGAPDADPAGVTELEAEVAALKGELEELRPAGDGLPAKSAAKPVWVAYAVEHGMTQADAEALTKDQLIERVTNTEGGQ